jgi:hypothetical protein
LLLYAPLFLLLEIGRGDGKEPEAFRYAFFCNPVQTLLKKQPDICDRHCILPF